MFGLTKRQFLKKSKKTLQETGTQTISLRGLMNQDSKGQIRLKDTQRGVDSLRNRVEETFSQQEKLNPPSSCLQLQQDIIKAMIIFHESVVSYSESLMAKEVNLEEKFRELLKKSNAELDEYTALSLSLSREVDSNLQKK